MGQRDGEERVVELWFARRLAGPERTPGSPWPRPFGWVDAADSASGPHRVTLGALIAALAPQQQA